MNAIFRHRDGFASGPALLMLAGLQMLVARPSHMPSPPSQEPIEIVLMAPPAEVPSPPRPPEPKPIAQPTAQPRPPAADLERARKNPKPIAQPTAQPRPAIAAPMTAPAGEASPPAPAPRQATETPLADPPLTPPSPPAPQPPRANPAAELEDAYVARVRLMLNAIKRYPTGREASLLRPSGSVRVWLVLDRNGQLLDRGIETSSHSLLLDNAALKTVSVGSYPPFPAELWAEQAQRRFHVDIDFVVPNG